MCCQSETASLLPNLNLRNEGTNSWHTLPVTPRKHYLLKYHHSQFKDPEELPNAKILNVLNYPKFTQIKVLIGLSYF